MSGEFDFGDSPAAAAAPAEVDFSAFTATPGEAVFFHFIIWNVFWIQLWLKNRNRSARTKNFERAKLLP